MTTFEKLSNLGARPVRDLTTFEKLLRVCFKILTQKIAVFPTTSEKSNVCSSMNYKLYHDFGEVAPLFAEPKKFYKRATSPKSKKNGG